MPREALNPNQFEHNVHSPYDDYLPYDDDPNNWTARQHPDHAFAPGSLRPIAGKPDGRNRA